MKLTLILALLSCQLASAQSNFFPLLRCKGHTYTNATIDTITPATVNVSWDTGGAKIPITDLPRKLQIRYHYNEQKARKYLATQDADKAAHKEHDAQDAAAFIAAQNTLGPAQHIRIIKTLLFPNSLQIEAEGVLSEGFIPKLPPEVLTFITRLDKAQTDATDLKLRALQVRNDANRARSIADGMLGFDSDYEEQDIQANAAQNDASAIELKSADATALVQKLQAQAKDRTTIIARPTGKMVTARIRQWQFQAMASTEVTDR